MINKTGKNYLFETKLNWLSEDRGIMYAQASSGPIYTTAPTAFGGSGKEWSPENLFLSAIISCYMSTFISFAKKSAFIFAHLECNVIGQVELQKGRYKFTIINVYPKIYINDISLTEKANEIVQKTQKYCLISNSINAGIIYHTQIVEDKHVSKPGKMDVVY